MTLSSRHGTMLGILVLALMALPLLPTKIALMPEHPSAPGAAFRDQYCYSETVTRREAILRYVTAMYCQDGYFHFSVNSPPQEGKLGLYPSAFDIDDGYFILKTLDATGIVDLTPSISLLRSLVNGPSSLEELRGLINYTAVYWPSVIVESCAVDLFNALGILDELDLDRIATYTAHSQMASGGFGESPTDPDPPDLTNTYFGVRLLATYGYLHLIDVDGVGDFVLKCQNPDGGFGETVGLESVFGVLPLALMTLDVIDRRSLLSENVTLQYLLGQWDNITGCHVDYDIASTERAIWSFSLLSALDLIDQQAAIDWILSCQANKEGAFRVYPGDESDRIWFCRVAVHALSLLDRLDALDDLFTVLEKPRWQVPQWYLDKIVSETTIATGLDAWRFPDLGAMLYTLWPLVPIALCAAPAIYWVMTERADRAKIRAARRERRPGRRHPGD